MRILQINTVFTLFTYLLPTPPMFSWLPLFFKFMISSTINIFIYNICDILHIIVVWHTYVYNLLSSFEYCLFVHVFTAVHLRLDNLLGSSSLEKTDPSSLSSHWLWKLFIYGRGFVILSPFTLACHRVAIVPLCRSCQF